MQSRSRIVFALVVMLANAASGAEHYIVQGRAQGAPLTPTSSLLWSTDAVFMNPGTAAARVAFLGASNGGLAPPISGVDVPPGKAISLRESALWSPTTDPLWVLHVDVPPSVLVENFLQIGYVIDVGGGAPPSAVPTGLGKTLLPVFRDLIPAGQEQFHLGSDLGVDRSARLNVAVYNAGAAPATVSIEIRNLCDNTVLAARSVEISADTLLQVGGFSAEVPPCLTLPRVEGVYTRVVSDQPGFSFVTVLAQETQPGVALGIIRTR